MTDNIRAGMVELLPRLRRFAYSLTGNRDQADDLVQDTCTRALARMEQWQPGTRLDSWMFRIAQNIWLDNMRARSVRGENVDLDTQHEISGSDGRDVTENRLTLADVSNGIALLPNDQRILVSLVCIEGLSYKEAATTLGIPTGTVMSRLARARATLHSALFAEPAPVAPQTMEDRDGRVQR